MGHKNSIEVIANRVNTPATKNNDYSHLLPIERVRVYDLKAQSDEYIAARKSELLSRFPLMGPEDIADLVAFAELEVSYFVTVTGRFPRLEDLCKPLPVAEKNPPTYDLLFAQLIATLKKTPRTRLLAALRTWDSENENDYSEYDNRTLRSLVVGVAIEDCYANSISDVNVYPSNKMRELILAMRIQAVVRLTEAKLSASLKGGR